MRRLNDWFTNLYQSRSSESSASNRLDQPIQSSSDQQTSDNAPPTQSQLTSTDADEEEMATAGVVSDEKSESERREDEIK